MKKLLILTAVIAAAVAVRAEVTPIDGENGVGFIQVTIPEGASQKILSVPFEACMSGPGAMGVLRDLISTNGLKAAGNPAEADQIVVLTTNASGPVYYYYWYKTGTGWETNQTVKLGGGETNVIPVVASNYPVARGLGFWLKRPADATGTTLYMKGQIPTSSVPITLDGGTNFTLIGLGALTTTNLNQVSSDNWGTRYTGGPGKMDKLLVVTNANGSYVQYLYMSSKWVDVDNQTDGEPQIAIQPGEGFWYLRRGANDLEFKPVVSQ
jgi:hypothetical protein